MGKNRKKAADLGGAESAAEVKSAAKERFTVSVHPLFLLFGVWYAFSGRLFLFLVSTLVALMHAHGVRVEAVPGPTAFATAVAVSGLPSRRFTFEGFLPVQKAQRRALLQALASETRTLVFYEAPHRLFKTLCDLLDAFGDRELALVKELTKLHETVERTTLREAVEAYRGKEVRGEYVLVLRGAEAETTTWSLPDAVERARALEQAGMGKTQAAKTAARESGLKKSEIYKALTGQDGGV